MTIEKTIEEMEEIAKRSEEDPESAHCDADKLLCSFLDHFGYGDLADAFNKVKKWYS